MPITSLSFALFVLGAVLIYYMLPHRAQIGWMLLCSYVFAFAWDKEIAVVLLLSTLVNYWLAIWLGKRSANKALFLLVGIVFNLAVIAIFRLGNFYVPEFSVLVRNFGMQVQEESFQVIIPVGLSFYTLGNISYLIDVYRKQLEPCTDLLVFGLYVAYFPKLLAGPIERAKSFLPKLEQPRIVNNRLLAQSAALIAIGLFRKIIVADTLAAAIPEAVFATPQYLSALDLWLWLFVYAFFIYNDFAGYTSIVRGIGGLFGIELSINFNFPYFSRNISEFWNRWHISLSHWLRDYIFFPLSKTLLRKISRRNHPINILIPPMVTMLVSGLWHGFSWNMLLWGGLHGLFIAVRAAFQMLRGPNIQKAQPWRAGISTVVTFLLVCFAWVPFRLDLPGTLLYWSGMFQLTNLSIMYRRVFLLFPLIIVSVIVDWLQVRRGEEQVFLRWPRPVQAGLLAGILFLVFILTAEQQGTPFVYQGF